MKLTFLHLFYSDKSNSVYSVLRLRFIARVRELGGRGGGRVEEKKNQIYLTLEKSCS
jgi:hypothetical protein